MGNCFESAEPTQPKDRQRTGKSVAGSPALNRERPQKSAPQGIGGTAKRRGKDEEGKFHVGSLTDRRQEEADDLQAHVNTTSAAFINVSQKPHLLNEKDAEERARYLESLLRQLPPLPFASPLLGLPPTAFEAADLGAAADALRAHHGLGAAEEALARDTAAAFAGAVRAARVADAGEFVIPMHLL